MRQDINLYQPRRRKKALPTRRWLAVASALLIASGAVWYGAQWRETAALQVAVARAQADAARVAKQAEQLPEALQRETNQLAGAEREVATLEALAERLTRGGLGATQGFAPQLRAFGRATTDGVWLTGIRIDNASGQLGLEGRALEAARLPHLLAALGREPAFAGLAFATLELKSVEDAGRGNVPADVVKFRVATSIRPATTASAATKSGNAQTVAQAGGGSR